MSSSDPTMVIILSEIIFFLVLILIAIFIFFILKKRSKAKFLKNLSTNISEDIEKREQKIKSELSGIPSVSDEKAQQIAHQAVKEEVAFYQYVIDLIHTNKNEKLELLQESVEKLVQPYFQISSHDTSSSDAGTSDEEPIIPNVDDAIDDLLDDASGDGADEVEFDLSDQDEIAEIPDDLLDDGEKVKE